MIVEDLDPRLEAVEAFQRLADWPHVLFLDSARRDPHLGRYSFVTADPIDFYRLDLASGTSLTSLAAPWGNLPSTRRPDLPPFQGGVAGLFGYDLAQTMERLPRARFDEFKLPLAVLGCYDVVLAFDHILGRGWLISQGWPEAEPGRRQERARQRAQQFLKQLARPASWAPRPRQPRLSADCLAPQYPVTTNPRLTSNFSRDGYLAAVGRAIEYIHAGDIFQVNLAQRLLHPATDDPRSLYLRLRERNPAPFAAYFDGGDFQLASASPERFLQVADGRVEARPIKGTRRRTTQPEADLFAGDELRASEKDRAENVMIVDLLRNDLSRVCLPDSVRVSQLCGLEVYAFVQHLVSTVEGTLRPGVGPLELLQAAFPGGSITGAPKVRAMEIIAELEPTARGAYCGSLGYWCPDGTLDVNILIRTITASQGWWQAPVGGGITNQSDPASEYEETWHKAEGLLRALQ